MSLHDVVRKKLAGFPLSLLIKVKLFFYTPTHHQSHPTLPDSPLFYHIFHSFSLQSLSSNTMQCKLLPPSLSSLSQQQNALYIHQRGRSFTHQTGGVKQMRSRIKSAGRQFKN
jgi:hypothetical protein